MRLHRLKPVPSAQYNQGQISSLPAPELIAVWPATGQIPSDQGISHVGTVDGNGSQHPSACAVNPENLDGPAIAVQQLLQLVGRRCGKVGFDGSASDIGARFRRIEVL